jgi:hypothetical protein
MTYPWNANCRYTRLWSQDRAVSAYEQHEIEEYFCAQFATLVEDFRKASLPVAKARSVKTYAVRSRVRLLWLQISFPQAGDAN